MVDHCGVGAIVGLFIAVAYDGREAAARSTLSTNLRLVLAY